LVAFVVLSASIESIVSIVSVAFVALVKLVVSAVSSVASVVLPVVVVLVVDCFGRWQHSHPAMSQIPGVEKVAPQLYRYSLPSCNRLPFSHFSWGVPPTVGQIEHTQRCTGRWQHSQPAMPHAPGVVIVAPALYKYRFPSSSRLPFSHFCWFEPIDVG